MSKKPKFPKRDADLDKPWKKHKAPPSQSKKSQKKDKRPKFDSMEPKEDESSKKPVISQEKDFENKKSRPNRYDPWRVENGKNTMVGESVLSIMVLGAMFLSAFGIGWTIGGALRQQTSQNSIAQVEEEGLTETEGQDGDVDEVGDQESESEDEEGALDETGEESTNEQPESVAIAPIPEPDITGKKLIALTFDDGPGGATTEQLLATLREKQVRATFFVLGYMAERAPQQLQKQASEGHEVGSHTTNHTAFSRMSATELAGDVARMNQLFTNTLGHPTPLVRPPYGDGAYSDKARTTVGQPIILWTVDTLDWKYRDVATVRQNAVKDAFDGAIILFHDIYQSTVDAIPLIIDDLRAQGYEFLTVSGLAKARGITMQNGAVYGSFR